MTHMLVRTFVDFLLCNQRITWSPQWCCGLTSAWLCMAGEVLKSGVKIVQHARHFFYWNITNKGFVASSNLFIKFRDTFDMNTVCSVVRNKMNCLFYCILNRFKSVGKVTLDI